MANRFVVAVDMRRRLVLAEDDVEDEEAFLDADVGMVGVSVSLCYTSRVCTVQLPVLAVREYE